MNALSTNSASKESVFGKFSGPYFPAFGLNEERDGVSLHIQSEWWKIRTRKTPNTDTSHAVEYSPIIPYITERFVVNQFKVTDFFLYSWKSKTWGFLLISGTIGKRSMAQNGLMGWLHRLTLIAFLIIFLFLVSKKCFLSSLYFAELFHEPLGKWNKHYSTHGSEYSIANIFWVFHILSTYFEITAIYNKRGKY